MATVTTGAGTIEVRPRAIRPEVAAPRSTRQDEWRSYFERVYATAAGDAAAVPWSDGDANPALVAWLNAEAPGLIRPGATVAVVGCGLGDDVRELSDRGYDAMGFDCSPTAVDWARRRHPDIADRLHIADLLSLPGHMLRRHDLVVEINTIQSLPPELRQSAGAGVVALARPRGIVLAICRGREEGEALEGPPFALTVRELVEAMAAQGLSPLREVDEFLDGEEPPKRRLRGMFRRA
jgi:hypothetical protein